MTAMRGQHLIGEVLGTCVLEKLLGSGGSSAVFLAQQHDPERKVAVKVFLPRSSVDIFRQRDFYRRFLREAEATSKLEHANIMPIYAYGEQEGLPYIVMPYMPGGTLVEYLAKRGPLSLQEALWYLEQLAEALDFAHAQGFVHCDVKPANILLDRDGLVMLSDFGIARLSHSELRPDDSDGRRQEAVLGTFDYISPEQALGRALDGRSDIYSLGVTIFFGLAKRLPFQADSPIALALLHVHEPPPSLSLLRGDITPALEQVIGKVLAKNPDDRYQTAKAFSDAFADALAEGEHRATVSAASSFSSDGDNDKLLTGPRPARFISRPFVQVKLVRLGIHTLQRMFFVGFALLIIVATISFMVVSLSKRSTSLPLRKPTATLSPVLSNYFMDQENWPRSQLFFFDQALRYHIVNNQAKGGSFAVYAGQQFRNFRLSVDVTELRMHQDQPDYQGVVFRVTPDQARYYLLEIAPAESHSVVFFRYDNGSYTYIKSGTFTASHAPDGHTNTITIESRGNSFQFFVNGRAVFHGPIVDSGSSPLLSGQIGFYLEDQGEVAFSHLSIGILP